MRVLILGATGMAGHMVYYYFSGRREFEIYTLCFRNKLTDNSIILDIHDIEGIKTVIKETAPDYIINCIGVLIKGSLASQENAIYINAYFPHILPEIIRENNLAARIIHISTDCVFSGFKGFYSDTDTKDALDVYGMTKNLGEIIDDTNLTIRTSIIGPELKADGEGLFHWLFSQKDADEVTGYTKSIWGGVTTLELAKAIHGCIKQNVTGLFQLTNGEKISKYELLRLIAGQFDLNITIRKGTGRECDKSIQASYRAEFDYQVPSYTAMIVEMRDFMYEHKALYTQYLR